MLTRATLTWGTAEELTPSPYSERAPAAVSDGADALLIYRSSESLRYSSGVYGATETLDPRYAGATTVDTRNAARLGLRGKFDDFEAFVYDAGHDGQRTN